VTAIGEPIERVVFPIDAVTSTLMELPEGESIEVGLMGAEGFVGLSLLYDEAIASTTVIIQIPGNGFEMRTADFAREVVQRDGEAYRLLLRYANRFFAVVAQVAACNASHSVEERLARWTLLVHDRVGRDRFPLTHEFLALMLGVRRAGVSQAASALRLAGAIDYTRGEMSVGDRKLLEKASCGCYQAITNTLESLFSDRA
jgi:CRP-like cAMP-binding protein